ncbi:MAG: fasciclin domain-containing protein [Armatimonadetes bacterium]|nr:fasciclin domain-containing protein [Armatimonadota bacterium]
MLVHAAIFVCGFLTSAQKQPTIMQTVNVQAHINYMATVYQAGDFSDVLREDSLKTVVVPNEKVLADDKAIDKAGGPSKYLKGLVAKGVVTPGSIKTGTKQSVKSIAGTAILFERKGESLFVNGQLVSTTVTCSNGIVYVLK